MENDNLKLIWQEIKTPQKSPDELSEIVKEKNHPTLRSIKRQAVFELLASILFLCCYYGMFDGIKKPLFINLILVFAISINILNHLKGYRLQQKFRASNTILKDLKNFASKLKSHRLETLISKVILIIGMMIFFTNGMQLTEKKWWIIGFLTIVFIAQLMLLNKIWANRAEKIKLILRDFEGV